MRSSALVSKLLSRSLRFVPSGLVAPLRKQKWLRTQYSQHQRSARKIEIDITYRCNQKCLHCNRSCPQAPARDDMSVEQVQRFVAESLQRKMQWDSIMVIGGEPTLHPKLSEILNILIDYKQAHSRRTALILATNGVGAKIRSVLRCIPEEVMFRNSEKENPLHFAAGYVHEPFNEAPQDSFLYRGSDFTIGCSMTTNCGTGLTPFGYYVCPIAGGGIDRVFGFDAGRKELPDPGDQMDEQRRLFCRLCGHFKEKLVYNGSYSSPTWKRAYQRFAEARPILTRY
ncbi:radical SAM protein [Acidobacteria bacterium AB60]|nr:radical SAM protein [Acidobacteria bacterium AB60]